jgi:hypothetical protein
MNYRTNPFERQVEQNLPPPPPSITQPPPPPSAPSQLSPSQQVDWLNRSLYSAPSSSSSFEYTHTRSISFYSTDTKVLFSKPGSDGWCHFSLPSDFIVARTLNPVKDEGYYVVACNTFLPTKKVYVLNDPGTKEIEVVINKIGEALILEKPYEKGFIWSVF